MAIGVHRPTSTIEGIGPATEEALAAAGIIDLLDLLLASRDEIHGAAGHLSSREEASSWRAMTRFLLLEDMTPQWAEALVRGGLATFSHLRDAEVAELQGLFRDALDDGAIPDVPDLEQIASLRVACAEAMWAGNLAVQLLVASGDGASPVAGASVRRGRSEATTDGRGRALLTRIPLGGELPLLITTADGQAYSISSPGALRGVDPIPLYEIVLEATDAVDSTARLSEFRGDRLEMVDGLAFRQERREVDSLREGDHVVLFQRLSSAPVVDLTSYFRESEPGTWITPVWRVAADVVPADAEVGDQFRVEGGALVRESLEPWQVELLRRQRRRRRFLQDYPAPQSSAEIRAMFEALKGVD